MSENTENNGRDPGNGRFAAGNPGRPKGARNRLGEAFVDALAVDFEEHGVVAIESVRNERPHEYLKVIAGILPKDLQITGEDGGPLTITWLPPE